MRKKTLKTIGFLLVGVGIILFIIAVLRRWSISIELAKLQLEYLKDNWVLITGTGVSFISGVMLMAVAE